MRLMQLGWILILSLVAAAAQAYDARWPDYNVVMADRGNAGAATYFQGFESPCFNPPYAPAPGENDWIRFYSEMTRVGTGTGGIASPGGRNHVEVRPPLAGAPAANSGAFTRLGGYRNTFGGGFRTGIEVYIDLSDPRVASGINANYGWDVTTAVNDTAGNHRRDFVFATASNTSGQVLVGTTTTTNFVPTGDLASRPHFVVTGSGWYTFEWVFRDAAGTLAVDLNLRNSAGTLLFTRTISDPADLIAAIGGNRYQWFTYVQSARLPIDNSRLNSGIVEPVYASTPAAGSTLNLGTTFIGGTTSSVPVNLQNSGALQLEVCGCNLSGPNAADFTVTSCPTLIQPGANATLNVSCTPTAAGQRTATLTIVTNDSTRGTNFTYALVCNDIAGLNTIAVPVRSPWALLLLGLSLMGVGAFVVRTRSG